MSNNQIGYVTPETDIYYVMEEGVLCFSNFDSGLDMDPDEGYM